MKVIPFLLTTLGLALVGVICYFALNNLLADLTAKQAQPGIIFFVGFAILISLMAAVLSGVAANYLIENKSWSLGVSALISVAVFFIIGVIILIAGVAISIAIVDASRF